MVPGWLKPGALPNVTFFPPGSPITNCGRLVFRPEEDTVGQREPPGPLKVCDLSLLRWTVTEL